VRAAYEMQFFSAFPDLAPEDEGMAYADDAIAVWGTLRGTSRGEWLGVPPGGGAFTVPFANIVPFRDGLMAGEIIYFDLATLCEQAVFLSRTFAPPRLHVARRRACEMPTALDNGGRSPRKLLAQVVRRLFRSEHADDNQDVLDASVPARHLVAWARKA
jgi:SnoaL-like polyketide cyclase